MSRSCLHRVVIGLAVACALGLSGVTVQAGAARSVKPMPLPDGGLRRLAVVGVSEGDKAISALGGSARLARLELAQRLSFGETSVLFLLDDVETRSRDFLHYPTRGNLVSRFIEFTSAAKPRDEAVVLWFGPVVDSPDAPALQGAAAEGPGAAVHVRWLAGRLQSMKASCRLLVLAVPAAGAEGGRALDRLARSFAEAPFPVLLLGLPVEEGNEACRLLTRRLVDALTGSGASAVSGGDILEVTAQSVERYLGQADDSTPPRPPGPATEGPPPVDPPRGKPDRPGALLVLSGKGHDRPIVRLLNVQAVLARRDVAVARLARLAEGQQKQEVGQTVRACDDLLLGVVEPAESVARILDKLNDRRRDVLASMAEKQLVSDETRRLLVTVRMEALAGLKRAGTRIDDLTARIEVLRQKGDRAGADKLAAELKRVSADRDALKLLLDDPGHGLPWVAHGWGKDRFVMDLGGGVTMPFVMIRPGTFTMGHAEGAAVRSEDEGPRHKVILTRRFYMSVTEVTAAQYAAVMTPDRPPAAEEVEMPQRRLKWTDAQAFCKKMTERYGVTVRLPTEAQWEYACRAGTTGTYYFGDDADKLKDHAWTEANSRGKVQPVGKLKPNPWGLYDMLGNVEEWTRDRYGKYPGGEATEPTGPDEGELRVLRGGSCISAPRAVRCSVRFGLKEDAANPYGGLRLILEP